MAIDLLVVLVFVVVGRRTHQEAETLAGVMETAAPFVAAVATGWVATRAWRRPAASSTGYGVVVATLVVGMALRALVFSEGIAATFVLVAAVFLSAGFLGWRLAVQSIAARRPQGAARV